MKIRSYNTSPTTVRLNIDISRMDLKDAILQGLQGFHETSTIETLIKKLHEQYIHTIDPNFLASDCGTVSS